MMTRETLRLVHLPLDIEDEILSRVPARSLRPLRIYALLARDGTVYSKIKTLFDDFNNEIHDNVVDPQTLLSLNDFNIPEQVRIYKIFLCHAWFKMAHGEVRR